MLYTTLQKKGQKLYSKPRKLGNSVAAVMSLCKLYERLISASTGRYVYIVTCEYCAEFHPLFSNNYNTLRTVPPNT